MGKDRPGERNCDHQRRDGEEPGSGNGVTSRSEGGREQRGNEEHECERESAESHHPRNDPQLAVGNHRCVRRKETDQEDVDGVVEALGEEVGEHDLERHMGDVCFVLRWRHLGECGWGAVGDERFRRDISEEELVDLWIEPADQEIGAQVQAEDQEGENDADT